MYFDINIITINNCHIYYIIMNLYLFIKMESLKE